MMEDFLQKHLATLELDQAKYNLLLGILNRKSPDTKYWSLGEGAACAIQTPPRFIVLGELSREQTSDLAQIIKDLEFWGCIGDSSTTNLFVEEMAKIGVHHELEMPQRIYLLDQKPIYPNTPGKGAKAQESDLEIFLDWFTAFQKEAVPNERPFSREQSIQTFQRCPVYFWKVKGIPVAMAARNRETKNGSNISWVYTPPELRGRGYGGAATAFACENAFQEGKQSCFLYTDLRNPISNRVYQKIGFKPWCDSNTFVRVGSP